jgi:hypothetical protein
VSHNASNGNSNVAKTVVAAGRTRAYKEQRLQSRAISVLVGTFKGVGCRQVIPFSMTKRFHEPWIPVCGMGIRNRKKGSSCGNYLHVP